MRIIYNVTINIEDSVHKEWLLWIKQHIVKVLETGKFESAKLSKILVEEELSGQSYSIQYTSHSRETLNAYYKEDAEALKNEGLKKFADKMLAFRTELEIIDEYKIDFN